MEPAAAIKEEPPPGLLDVPASVRRIIWRKLVVEVDDDEYDNLDLYVNDSALTNLAQVRNSVCDDIT